MRAQCSYSVRAMWGVLILGHCRTHVQNCKVPMRARRIGPSTLNSLAFHWPIIFGYLGKQSFRDAISQCDFHSSIDLCFAARSGIVRHQVLKQFLHWYRFTLLIQTAAVVTSTCCCCKVFTCWHQLVRWTQLDITPIASEARLRSPSILWVPSIVASNINS